MKEYICRKWPSLQVGADIKFKNGFFATDDPEVQAKLESRRDFNVHIFEYKGRPGSEKPKVEAMPLDPVDVRMRKAVQEHGFKLTEDIVMASGIMEQT